MALIGAHKVHKHPPAPRKSLEDKFPWTRVTRPNKKSEEFRWLYEGEISNRKAHGFGVLSRVYRTGEIDKVYAGNWVDGKKQGFGSFWYFNGDFFQGDFCRGKKHGFGRLWGADGSFYQGNWREDHFDGSGMLIQPDGNRYEGNFSQGKKQGYGKFYHLKSGQIQEGFWWENVCKRSCMIDVSREEAPEPTIYPIPELGKYTSRVSLEVSELSN